MQTNFGRFSLLLQIIMNEQRNWLTIITPCRIAIVLSIIGIIYAYADLHASGGWSFIAVMALFFFSIVVLILDFIIALILKKKGGLIWLVEIILLVITVLIFRSYWGLGD